MFLMSIHYHGGPHSKEMHSMFHDPDPTRDALVDEWNQGMTENEER